MTDVLQMNVTGQDDLRRLSKQLRTVGDGKAIRRGLTKGLRAGAQPAAVRAKQAALALPNEGASAGARRKIAGAVGVSVRTTGRRAGVAVRVSRARAGDKAGLARVSNDGRWRHPVFGNRDVWVTQTSRRAWFDDSVRLAGPGVRHAVKQVLDDIERRMAHR